MSMLLRKIARYAAQKVASNPEAKEMAVKAARSVAEEAKQIANLSRITDRESGCWLDA